MYGGTSPGAYRGGGGKTSYSDAVTVPLFFFFLPPPKPYLSTQHLVRGEPLRVSNLFRTRKILKIHTLFRTNDTNGKMNAVLF